MSVRATVFVFIVIVLSTPGWPDAAANAADLAPSYTTQPGDTLGRIARHYLQDETISPFQMMVALFRTNPEAFMGNNIHNLKVGYNLRLPDRTTVLATGAEEAEAIVKRQYATWLQSRLPSEPSAPPRLEAPVEVREASPHGTIAAEPEVLAPLTPADPLSLGTARQTA
jgi:pilus assembly protein FimV